MNKENLCELYAMLDAIYATLKPATTNTDPQAAQLQAIRALHDLIDLLDLVEFNIGLAQNNKPLNFNYSDLEKLASS
jgi:hypothetical protein